MHCNHFVNKNFLSRNSLSKVLRFLEKPNQSLSLGSFIGGLVARLALLLISVYKSSLALFLGGSCRFYPSCSNYAQEAFQTYSPLYAFFLSLKRFAKCYPLGPKGYDPLPSNCLEQTSCGEPK